LDVFSIKNSFAYLDIFSIKFPDEDEGERFCGLERNREGNEMPSKDGTGNPVITFASDDSVQHKGFKVNYRSKLPPRHCCTHHRYV